MPKRGKPGNIVVTYFIVTIIITLIGYVDYLTGAEMSFSVIYLVPLAILAMRRNSKTILVLSAAILAAAVWFFADWYTREYSNILYSAWNTFVRVVIFVAIGLLLHNFKENELRLKALNRKLEEANEEKNKFIGVAAHDLRSPIGAIHAFSDLLLDRYHNRAEPEIIRIIQLIKKTSGDTLVVLKNLLDISTIESGKVELKINRRDYTAFVKEQIELYRILAIQKNIHITCQPSQDHIFAEFDENYMSEVLGNLLTNAVKYSGEGMEITVAVDVSDDKVITEVSDRGSGISDIEQQKLFRFFQTTSTRPTGGEKSTGLGLAIAKQIVLLHKGEIGVESTPGAGARFYYSFPLKQELG